MSYCTLLYPTFSSYNLNDINNPLKISNLSDASACCRSSKADSGKPTSLVFGRTSPSISDELESDAKNACRTSRNFACRCNDERDVPCEPVFENTEAADCRRSIGISASESRADETALIEWRLNKSDVCCTTVRAIWWETAAADETASSSLSKKTWRFSNARFTQRSLHPRCTKKVWTLQTEIRRVLGSKPVTFGPTNVRRYSPWVSHQSFKFHLLTISSSSILVRAGNDLVGLKSAPALQLLTSCHLRCYVRTSHLQTAHPSNGNASTSNKHLTRATLRGSKNVQVQQLRQEWLRRSSTWIIHSSHTGSMHAIIFPGPLCHGSSANTFWQPAAVFPLDPLFEIGHNFLLIQFNEL